MRYLFKNDVAVQVWREERQVPLEYAKFYKGIFDVGLIGLTHIIFVPSFPKTADNWPPRLPDNIDLVDSCNQARLFMAGIATWTVTPDEELAGKREFITVPPMQEMSSTMDIGVLFYVTPEEFVRFSQELLYIEKNYTLWANQYVPLSTVKDFECMKFILANILPLEESYKANGGRLIINESLAQNSNRAEHNGQGVELEALVDTGFAGTMLKTESAHTLGMSHTGTTDCYISNIKGILK